LYLLGPILDWMAGHLSIDKVIIFNGIIWNGLFLSLFRYDWSTSKKIQWISWTGFIWFYILWVISIYS